MPVRVTFLLVLLVLAGITHAGEIDAKVEAALAAESRPEADVERDRNRKPLETLKFFGLEDDMTVLELLPGRGWYTRVLAPVLAENQPVLRSR
jgi:predicted methyltransferase